MAEVANLYDNGPISPIAKIKENLSIYSAEKWEHYRIEYIEGMPRSSPLVVDLVAIALLTTLPAGGTIAKQLVPVLQLNKNEFLHLRWEPLDDVEGLLWLPPGIGRYQTASVVARVSRFSAARDPYLATTTFCILGSATRRDMNLEARNPSPAGGYARPQARFAFQGFRYILEKLPAKPPTSTWVVADGRQV